TGPVRRSAGVLGPPARPGDGLPGRPAREGPATGGRPLARDRRVRGRHRRAGAAVLRLPALRGLPRPSRAHHGGTAELTPDNARAGATAVRGGPGLSPTGVLACRRHPVVG